MNKIRDIFFLLLIFCSGVCFAQKAATYVIYFAPNSFTPTVGDEFRLESFLVLPDSLTVKGIDIHGYTDDIGDKIYNDTLSERRARKIRSLLTELGVQPNLIVQTKGKGERPVGVGLNAEQQRALNRRVEVTITYQRKKQPHHHHHATHHPQPKSDSVAAARIKQKADSVFIMKKDTVVIVKRDTVFLIRENNEIKPTRKEEKVKLERDKDNLIPDTIEVGDKITLPNILFEAGTRRLLKESYPTLDQLAMILTQRPDLRIKILGHICCQKKGKDGTDDETGKKNLSVVRAKAVYEYLIAKGIDKDRLQYKGMKANFKTGKGAHYDRRVEIEIINIKKK